jgi:hypothetical protein
MGHQAQTKETILQQVVCPKIELLKQSGNLVDL